MTFGYSFNIWVPLLLFPTAGPNGAPRWKKGWPVAFVFFFLLWAGFMTAIIIHQRYVYHDCYRTQLPLTQISSEKRKEAALSAQESTDEDVETIIVDRDAHSKAGSKD